MRQHHSNRQHAEKRIPFSNSTHPGPGPDTPRVNRLLAALPLDVYERLLPGLTPVPLPRGWTLHRAGDPEKYLYFLTAGIVSRYYVTENGASAAFAVTGSEGVIGVASFLGGESTPSQAMVLSAGRAYRLGADRLKREFEHVGALPLLLLRYTQALIAQTTQTVVCNRFHSVEQQLCRCILSCIDRALSADLAITQESLADMLGVRREAVTQAAGRLQALGLIRYTRGRVAVLERRQLEARACECYAAVRQEYERLLPPGLRPGTGALPIAGKIRSNDIRASALAA
jgi:CRP-like cAMP-binding protein